MVGKGRSRKAFGQRISHILRTCALQQLDVAIKHELPQIMHSSVNIDEDLQKLHHKVVNAARTR
jgi:hypothetical protein